MGSRIRSSTHRDWSCLLACRKIYLQSVLLDPTNQRGCLVLELLRREANHFQRRVEFLRRVEDLERLREICLRPLGRRFHNQG